MLSVYKNERTGHTFQTEKRSSHFVVVERDYMGELCQTLHVAPTRAAAQDVLDRIADAMEWKYCGKQPQDDIK